MNARSARTLTPFDLPLAVFLATAAVGVWAAYDRQAAWQRWWVLLGAVGVYYLLALQPQRRLWPAAGLLSLGGALAAIYFMLAHDWQAFPADLGFLNRLALRWMDTRPELGLPAGSGAGPWEANFTGGLLAMLIPLGVGLGLQAVRLRRWGWAWLAAASIALSGLGLVFTSSRAAWLAVALALGVWALWSLSGFAARSRPERRPAFFALAILALGVGLVLVSQSLGLADRLSSVSSAGSRLEIARGTAHLVTDYPFTGGGLGSFPGLYSHYVQVVPFYTYSYGHNLYLDAALEQGLPGLAMLLVVLLGSAWLVARSAGQPAQDTGLGLLRWAIFSGLLVVLVHGLADDALYSNRNVIFLFGLPGMAVALSPKTELKRTPVQARRQAVGLAAVAAVALLAAAGLRGTLLGAWYANLGAVEMGRVELADFPAGKWDSETEAAQKLVALTQAEALLHQALHHQPSQPTAHHRLGLIAMQRRDFPTAVAHLEQAFQGKSDHRGIQKTLGFGSIWVRNYEQAVLLLRGIPEARAELDVYTHWWGAQGDDDLAQAARQVMTMLQGE